MIQKVPSSVLTLHSRTGSFFLPTPCALFIVVNQACSSGNEFEVVIVPDLGESSLHGSSE